MKGGTNKSQSSILQGFGLKASRTVVSAKNKETVKDGS